MIGPRAWGAELEKSNVGDAVFDRDRDRELHRLVDLDAVAVEQPFRRHGALGQTADRRAQRIGGAVEDGGERAGDGFGAEPRAQFLDAIGPHFRDRDLRPDVAAHELGLAAVGEDDAFDVGEEMSAVPDLDRRNQQALVIHLGRVGRCRARDRATDIGLVRDRTREGDDLAARENRRDERHVGHMRQSAGIGMVRDEHVAVFQRVQSVRAVGLEDRADQMAVDRRVEEHRRRHDQPAGAIDDHAGEIARLPDDRRIARAIEVIVHLVGEAGDLVAQDLNRDRVHGQALLDHEVAQRIDTRSPPGRHDRRRVELFDDGGSVHGRADIDARRARRSRFRAAPAHRNRRAACPWALGARASPDATVVFVRLVFRHCRPGAGRDSSPPRQRAPWRRDHGSGRDARRSAGELG